MYNNGEGGEVVADNKNETNINYADMYGEFDCPGCGRSTRNGDNIYDAGNGFCQDCAPEH